MAGAAASAAPAAAPATVGVAAQHSVISKLSESRQSRNIPTGVTQLPLSRYTHTPPPVDVAAYAPAQVPPTPNRAPLPPSFLSPFFQLLISINDKHIAKALWAPRPCPRNAYIIYIRITINVVPQRRNREGDEEADVAKQKKPKSKPKKNQKKKEEISQSIQSRNP